MKIAIHHREGSFSDYWIKYCENNHIDFKIVNCYDTNIINQLEDCDGLMWHHHHGNYKDALFAKDLLFSLEHVGMKVFPDFHTTWHFDDKVGQKYLLEAINAPLVPSYVFYDKTTAFNWAKETSYPKVFKLRGGAGATNVRLVKDFQQCQKIINRAFNKGFSQHDPWYGLRDIINKYKNGAATIKNILGGITRIIQPKEFERMANREKGYAYFQEFIPNNDSDIRLIVIGGEYAYGMKRMNRKNDFRASGSSNFVYEAIPLEVVKLGFSCSKKLKLQSAAFDFIFDGNNKPLIIEISYGFGTKGSSKCPGYWTSDLKWHKGKFNPQGWMVENLIQKSKRIDIEN